MLLSVLEEWLLVQRGDVYLVSLQCLHARGEGQTIASWRRSEEHVGGKLSSWHSSSGGPPVGESRQLLARRGRQVVEMKIHVVE